jgi:hypothetical protein
VLQTVELTHELFAADEVTNLDAELFQGDVGTFEVTVSFTRDGQVIDLAGCTLSVTVLAPNGLIWTYVADGSEGASVRVNGSAAVWTFGAFETLCPGVYTAQVRLCDDKRVATAVFLRYDVKRSVSGQFAETPTVFPTYFAMLQKSEEVTAVVDALIEIANKGLSWNTLIGKPEVFPPAVHTHPYEGTAQKVSIEDAGGHYLSGNVEDALQDVAGRFNGVRYEIANKEIAVPVGAWTENAAAMRKEAVIADALIRADTDVDLQLSDAQNGKYSIQALRPQNGSVTIYTTDSIPGEALSFVMSISEVRENA